MSLVSDCINDQEMLARCIFDLHGVITEYIFKLSARFLEEISSEAYISIDAQIIVQVP